MVAMVGLVGAAMVGAGCGATEPSQLLNDVAVETEPGVVRVLALDNRFIPPIVDVAAGDRIAIVNGGRNEHNVIASRGGSGWGIDEDEFVRNSVYEVTFNSEGTAYFYCDIHGDEFNGMIGQINVSA